MELRIFNKNLDFIGVIDSYNSLKWTRKHYTAGDFELNLSLTKDNINLLQKGYFIFKESELGVIEYINPSKESNSSKLAVKGYLLTGILKKRIIDTIKIFSSQYHTAENAMRVLIYDSCINVAYNPLREISNLIVHDSKNYPGAIDLQVSYVNLLEQLEKIGTTYQLGIRVNFLQDTKQFEFEVYKGIDRTINQNTVPHIVFDMEFDNVISQNYIDSDENYKNVALVAGAGEGFERITQYVNDTASGLDRNEVFIDARDLTNVREDKTTIPEEEYAAMLNTRGFEKLGEFQTIQTFEGQISTSSLNYRIDYDLGDWVTRRDKELGITLDTQITEITEVYQNNSRVVDITFGNRIPTKIEKLRSELK